MKSIHEQLHEKALHISSEYLRFESQLIGVLQELDRNKTFLHFGQPSLFAYVTKYLKLSESIALTLIGIARKSRQIPELKAAVEEKKISVHNARRIVPILNAENKTEWLEKAATLSQVKLDQELAKSFPDRAAPTKIKYKTEINARLEVDLPTQTLALLKRAQEILAQKNRAHIDVAQALEAVLEEFVKRHDPMKKSERALMRKPVAQIQTTKKLHVLRRVPLNATLKHQVTHRDQNQCAHIGRDGVRCQAKQWLDVHHIKEVSQGGTNELQNLKTLCSAHHKFMHDRQYALSG